LFDVQMDLGVGSFVFSLGLVAALPFLRQAALPRDASASSLASYLAALARTARKTAPLVALGLVRVVMVKGVDYPVRSFPLLAHALDSADALFCRSTSPSTASTGTSSSRSRSCPSLARPSRALRSREGGTCTLPDSASLSVRLLSLPLVASFERLH